MISFTTPYLILVLGCLAEKSEKARSVNIAPSLKSWALIGACTGGRCPGTQGGTLKSPNYPENYPDKADVKYILETEEGSHIELVFNAFSLEDSLGGVCSNDYVRVINTNRTTFGKFCGENRPGPIKSDGSKMSVRFYSDATVNRRGFEANWKSIKNPSSGEFKSPNYPNKYPNRVRMHHRIEAPKGKRIQLKFEDFETEACCDRLRIEGVSRRIGSKYEYFSGNISDLTLTSFTNRVSLFFRSDTIIRKRGFLITWKHVD